MLKRLLDRVVATSRGYDAAQLLVAYPLLARRIRRQLAAAGPGRILDAGAGTGTLAALLPPGSEYVALDVDETKLARARSRRPDAELLVRSVTDTGLPDASVDVVACVNVSHHLDDADFASALDELARVAARAVVFVDAVATRRLASRALWALDRGSNPRSEDVLRRELAKRLAVDSLETVTLVHRYLVCRGRPLR